MKKSCRVKKSASVKSSSAKMDKKKEREVKKKKGAAKKPDIKIDKTETVTISAEPTPIPARHEEESLMRLTAEELAYFRNILSEKRRTLLNQARVMLESQDEFNLRTSDEIDQASVEYDQSFEYRLRDREKFLLRKIDKALARIEEGEYDICESCSEPIGKKRLEARPETTLCIICKEEQEHHEKMFQKKRQLRATIEF